MAKLPTFSSEPSGMIRGYTPEAGRAAQQMDVRVVVSHLQYNHLDPAGAECRIRSHGSVRLDRQSNLTEGGANLQIQLNDDRNLRLPANSGTTIAQVIVPASVFETANTCHETNVRTHLENVVRSALIQSAASFGFARVVRST